MKAGAEEQKAELVSDCGFDTKDFSKGETFEAQRGKEMAPQNGRLNTEEEEVEEVEEGAKGEGKLPHSHTHKHQGIPWSIEKAICGLEWVSVCTKRFQF